PAVSNDGPRGVRCPPCRSARLSNGTRAPARSPDSCGAPAPPGTVLRLALLRDVRRGDRRTGPPSARPPSRPVPQPPRPPPPQAPPANAPPRQRPSPARGAEGSWQRGGYPSDG